MELYLHSLNTPPWSGAQLKHRDNFTFTFYELPSSGLTVSTPCDAQTNTVVKRKGEVVLVLN
jgi:hypothetical protein